MFVNSARLNIKNIHSEQELCATPFGNLIIKKEFCGRIWSVIYSILGFVFRKKDLEKQLLLKTINKMHQLCMDVFPNLKILSARCISNEISNKKLAANKITKFAQTLTLEDWSSVCIKMKKLPPGTSELFDLIKEALKLLCLANEIKRHTPSENEPPKAPPGLLRAKELRTDPFNRSLMPKVYGVNTVDWNIERLGDSINTDFLIIKPNCYGHGSHGWKCLAAIADFARRCLKRGLMPKKILEQGYFDLEYKTVKFIALDLEAFDPHKMEQILHIITRNHKHALADIMNSSKIEQAVEFNNRNWRTLSLKAVENTLKGKKFYPENELPIVLGTKDQKLKIVLESLCRHVLEIKGQILVDLSKYDFNGISIEKVGQNLSDLMLSEYIKSRAISVLSEELFSAVISKILIRYHFVLKDTNLDDVILKTVLNFLENDTIRTQDDAAKKMDKQFLEECGIFNKHQGRYFRMAVLQRLNLEAGGTACEQ